MNASTIVLLVVLGGGSADVDDDYAVGYPCHLLWATTRFFLPSVTFEYIVGDYCVQVLLKMGHNGDTRGHSEEEERRPS